MHELELQIADLDLEIALLQSSVQATANPDARRWLAMCLTICLRERSRLADQFRLAALVCLEAPLRERSAGQATDRT